MPAPEKSRARKAWQIFLSYIKSMLFAFTGGSVTLPLLQQQLADKYGLISREQTVSYFALAQTIPGVISVNMGVLCGMHIAGPLGAVAAVAGTLLPAFFGMLLITLSYSALSAIPVITGVIGGIRAASVAIILLNAITIMEGAKDPFHWVLVAGAFFTTLVLGWNILLVILGCGILGVLRTARAARKGGGAS